MTSDKSIQCLSCLCVTKELEQKKQVNFYVSCPPSSVYSPASILLAETFYQELARRLLEELLFTFFILNSKRKREATWLPVIRLEMLLKIKPKGKQNKFKLSGEFESKARYGVVLFSSLFTSLCMFLFPDIIKEVIDQQSTIYDNVTIVANFFKYEQVSLFLNLALLLQTLL